VVEPPPREAKQPDNEPEEGLLVRELPPREAKQPNEKPEDALAPDTQ